MSTLKVGPHDLFPELIIFDKDGTLIDFNFMWARWVVELARRLEAASGLHITSQLFDSFGYDPKAERVLPDGPLAAHSMASLRERAVTLLGDSGLSSQAASDAVAAAWFTPDAVKMARPLADLPRLFAALRESGIKIAVATSDDRTATEQTLAGLGIAHYVDTIISADDGLPIKPAADMILHLCEKLGVSPAKTVMIGDVVADMQMARAAGVGLVIGVTSGVSRAELLAPHADVLVASVASLI